MQVCHGCHIVGAGHPIGQSQILHRAQVHIRHVGDARNGCSAKIQLSDAGQLRIGGGVQGSEILGSQLSIDNQGALNGAKACKLTCKGVLTGYSDGCLCLHTDAQQKHPH